MPLPKESIVLKRSWGGHFSPVKGMRIRFIFGSCFFNVFFSNLTSESLCIARYSELILLLTFPVSSFTRLTTPLNIISLFWRGWRKYWTSRLHMHIHFLPTFIFLILLFSSWNAHSDNNRSGIYTLMGRWQTIIQGIVQLWSINKVMNLALNCIIKTGVNFLSIVIIHKNCSCSQSYSNRSSLLGCNRKGRLVYLWDSKWIFS